MPTKKSGAAISRQDKNGHELFVGDFVRSENGKVYQINKYTNLFNPKTGNTSWKVAGNVELITKEQYEAAIGAGPKINENAAFKAAPVEDLAEVVAEIEAVSDDEALDILRDMPSSEDTIGTYTDAELLEELRMRGFSGKLLHAITTYEEVTL